MIKTRFFLSCDTHDENTIFITLVADIPFRLCVGEEVVVDDASDWIIKIQEARYNLVTRELEVYLEGTAFNEEQEQNESMQALYKAGWINEQAISKRQPPLNQTEMQEIFDKFPATPNKVKP